MLRLMMLCCLCLTQALSADWPHFRGPDQTTGRVSDAELSGWNGAKEVWRSHIGTGFSSVVIADGRAIATGNSNDTDTVFCLDAQTGTEIWHYSYPAKLEPKAYEGGPNATPTIADGFVYGLSKQGQVWCLALKDGSLIWKRDLQKEEHLKPPNWGFSGAPLVYGKGLILNAGPAGICLVRSNGKTAWKSGTGDGAGYAAPVLASDSKLAPVLIFAAKHLIAVDPARGKEIWRSPWATSYDVNAATPVACANGWFVSTGYGRGCGLIKAKGNKAASAWENRNMLNQMAGCVLIGKQLYGVSALSKHPGELRCLDPEKEGAVLWKEGGFGQGTLIAVDDKLLVLSGDGELSMVAADPGRFRCLGKARLLTGTGWAPPAYADGKLYVRNSKGNLVCVALR